MFPFHNPLFSDKAQHKTISARPQHDFSSHRHFLCTRIDKYLTNYLFGLYLQWCMGDKTMKTNKIKLQIEENRETISKLLSGRDTVKRLNNLNWITHELTVETQVLFQCPDGMPKAERDACLDYTSMSNLAKTWEYILKHQSPKHVIDNMAIRKIHSLLAHGTDIPGGQYRLVDVYVLRTSAPDFNDMLYKMDDVQYNLGDTNTPVLTRAFNAHYDIIAAQPFNDFNKRTSRMVMNWFLVQNGYRPILFNHPSDKHEYMDALRARANGDCKTYSHYMYSCMLRTQREIISLLNKSRIL